MSHSPSGSSNATTSPSVGLIPLRMNEDDEPEFIEIASRLITGAARYYSLPIVYTIHIDNWFGDRWLGFRGKIFGIAGMHNRTLKRALVLPPFHPHRVLGGTEYHLSEEGQFKERADLKELHKLQPSGANVRRAPIRRKTLHAWYSGNTTETQKGVVMVYFMTEDATKAWYVMFNGDAGWRLDQHVGITRRETTVLLESAAES